MTGSGFSIRNDPAASTNAAVYVEQARPDAGDIAVLVAAIGGSGVVSGCEVTSTGSLGLAIASGSVAVAGTTAAVGGGTATLAAADPTNPRIDIVVSSPSGAVSFIAGTPAAIPVWPLIPDGGIVLAAIVVPAAAVSIDGDNIVDKRVLILAPATSSNEPTVPAFRDGVSALFAYNAGSVSLVIPSDVIAGDLLLVGITGQPDDITMPSGWTADADDNPRPDASSPAIAVYSRSAVLGDAGATLDIGVSNGAGTGDNAVAILVAYSGSPSVDVADAVVLSATTNGVGPSVTTTRDNAQLVSFFVANNGNDAAPTLTAVTGTERIAASTVGSYGSTILVSDLPQPSAGASAAQSASSPSSTAWAVATVAISSI
jgi:hypothetical protein